MRVAGIVLMIVGVLMIVFSGFNFTQEKNVAKIGPVEVNKEETKHIGWPTYTGGIILLAGIAFTLAGRKK
jgi:drug/metabolite transporter (DMT)-like permease